jgi:hypothetical protein
MIQVETIALYGLLADGPGDAEPPMPFMGTSSILPIVLLMAILLLLFRSKLKPPLGDFLSFAFLLFPVSVFLTQVVTPVHCFQGRLADYLEGFGVPHRWGHMFDFTSFPPISWLIFFAIELSLIFLVMRLRRRRSGKMNSQGADQGKL